MCVFIFPTVCRKLNYMVAQASRCSPITIMYWREPRELDMAHTAPDIASLALYDYYPHPQVHTIQYTTTTLTHRYEYILALYDYYPHPQVHKLTLYDYYPHPEVYFFFFFFFFFKG